MKNSKMTNQVRVMLKMTTIMMVNQVLKKGLNSSQIGSLIENLKKKINPNLVMRRKILMYLRRKSHQSTKNHFWKKVLTKCRNLRKKQRSLQTDLIKINLTFKSLMKDFKV